ncbi:efflux RND transporter periplasmic adaptor subunit [Endozoicomonas montiporae]|uniref:Multidrug resistance protein MdtA n=1 Tax=Endozoicomonas montiporae CL-33 TaxID=570277 RepID=A0A142B915_9GAMM|nr:efflux RND transporter periplasmic adaptor subunit [Endozoicomonas montiporae]AMO55241.1 multidrug resistance protein MdtA [Endozoicomonas montiporae CL-33]
MPALHHYTWFVALTLSCTFYFTLSLPAVASSAQGKPSVSVATETVQYQQHSRPIRTSGILAYKSQQTLSFKTAGPVAQLLVDEGDRVLAGQLLASLTMEEINAQVDEAKARLDLAKRNLERISKLHKNNVVSLDQLQSAETELAVAQSRLRITLFNQRYSRIDAPSPGLVLRRHVEENELVTPNQPVLVVADTSRGWVLKTGLTDEEIVRVKKNDRAQIQFDAWPDQTFTGQVTRLAALADERTGTFQVEITFPETTSKLRSGFVGKVTLIPSSQQLLALIPIESVVNASRTRADVFVYNPDKQSVTLRNIHLNFIESGFIASESGLAEGERVISSGAGFLLDGDTVILAEKVVESVADTVSEQTADLQE